MIDSYSFALIANVPSRINASGEFFRLLDGAGVNVTFLVSGARVGTASNMNGGFFARTRAGEPFDSVELVSSSSQSVSFLVGDAESGAASSVSVSGAVVVQGKTNRVSSRQSFSVGVSSMVIAPYPPNPRKGLLLQNVGLTNIWFNIDLAAAVGNSFLLVPGQAFSMEGSGAFEGTFYAVSDAVGGVVYVAQVSE